MDTLRQYQDHKRLEKEEARLLRQERGLLKGEEPGPLERRLAPIQEKIPQGLERTLTAAFAKGLDFLVSSRYSPVDRTVNREKLSGQYEQSRQALDQRLTRGTLRSFERQSRRSGAVSQGIALTEGAALGLLGIGLPDIPVFLGLLLRAVYEVGEGYGHTTETQGERQFALLILCCAFSRGEEQRDCFARCDALGQLLDRGETPPPDPRLSEETAQILARGLLFLKFIQGLPLVGAAGGLANGPLLGRVNKTARIKYQKRLLARLRQRCGPFGRVGGR